MKVVLNENVKGLGKKLDIVNVSEGYARNFLFPKKLAVAADNKSVSEATTKKEAIQFKKDTDRNNAQKLKSESRQIAAGDIFLTASKRIVLFIVILLPLQSRRSARIRRSIVINDNRWLR